MLAQMSLNFIFVFFYTRKVRQWNFQNGSGRKLVDSSAKQSFTSEHYNKRNFCKIP